MGEGNQIVSVRSGLETLLAQIDALLKATLLFCIGAVLVKLTGTGSLSFAGISISKSIVMPFLLVISACHVYLAFQIIETIAYGWKELGEDERRAVFWSLCQKNLLTRGFDGLEVQVSDNWLVVRRPPNTPTGLFTLFSFFICIFSVAEPTFGWWLPVSIIAGGLVSSFNWAVASSWIVAFQDFGLNRRSLYFVDNFSPRLRYFSAVSHPYFGSPLRPTTFTIMQLRASAFWWVVGILLIYISARFFTLVYGLVLS